MLNRVVLIGRLTRDPEIRFTSGGQALANFAIAVDRPFTNQQGERETDFINIVAWRQQAEFAQNYLTKGRLVAVDGRLQLRSYTDREGVQRKSTEVVAEHLRGLDRPKEQGDGSMTSAPQGGSMTEEAPPYDDPFRDE